MSKPKSSPKPPSEVDVLRRMLATPPAPHKPPTAPAKKQAKRAK